MEIKGNINAGYGNIISASTKSSIVGGIGNVVVGNNNIIGGGSGNTVNTNYGVIVGGSNNQIPSGAAYQSSIVGGNNNQILNSNESFIGGGDSNELRQSSNNSFIGGGYNNRIGTTVTATDNAPVSVIVGGGNNYISSGGKGDETKHGFIGGGFNNYLLEGTFSFIGAGTNNRITGTTNTIVAGAGNTIKGLRNFIGGGDTNIIESASDVVIGGGKNNYIGDGADYSAIINGANNYIKPIGSSGPFLQPHNLIGGGKGNRITTYSNAPTNRGYNVILGSEKANIYGYSFTTHNTIIGTGWLWSPPISNYSSAIKGGTNTILGGAASYLDRNKNPTTGITHGIIGYSYVSTLIGGYGNLINRGYYSIIGGGYHNYIDNGSNNFIGTGYFNTIKDTSYSVIGGGLNNYINNGGTASILGGSNNYINGAQSTIVSGRDNILKTNYSTILGGYANHSKHFGSQIIGSHVESISVNTTSVKSLNIQTIPMSNSMKTLGVDANGIVTDDNIVSLNEITGYTNQYYLRIAGSATTVGFASNTMSRDGQIVDSVQTSNGDIYLVGTFTSFGHYEYRNIVKLTENGIIDPSFTSYAGVGGIQTVDVQSDGKILIGGDFTTYSGQSYFRIVRLNTDGTIDGTFSVGTGFNNRVTSIKVQPDGKILVGGFFTNYNGSSRSRIVRLNTNGTIDGTFSIGTGFNNSVNSVSLQSDGKILVGGNFINYNGTGAVRFARLNTGGTIDGTFTTGTGFNNQVYDSVELSDGKILVGGQFTTCDGNTAQCIARLTSTGSFDATFSAATGFTITTGIAVVRSLIEDSDNKYLVGGQFNAYSGQAYNHIVRFETGGTIDTTFISVGEGFEKTTQAFGEPIVYTILELNNGTYLTSGYRLQKFVNPDINVRASHYNIDKNGNVLNISYSREEYKTSVANLLSGVPTFTGNTSGDCITDLYVTNLYGCSPLHIEPSGLNDVYIVENGGNVGIGTTNPQYKLEVNGTFGATSKSFDIPHPTKEGKRLRYGSLEGPEYGVYVRGKLSGENIIELPEYWAGLVDENSITVQLTPHGRKQDLFVGEIINNTVEVLGDDNPECYYMVLGERKDIDRITVEY